MRWVGRGWKLLDFCVCVRGKTGWIKGAKLVLRELNMFPRHRLEDCAERCVSDSHCARKVERFREQFSELFILYKISYHSFFLLLSFPFGMKNVGMNPKPFEKCRHPFRYHCPNFPLPPPSLQNTSDSIDLLHEAA